MAADLNSILFGQQGQNTAPGVPQVPPGVLQQSAVPPVAPPAQLPPGALEGQIQQPQAASAESSSPGVLDGFTSLVDKVRSDPALAQAAMMAGIRLAQGARPGQSTLGLLGDTAQMGMTAYQMLEGNKRTQEMADQAFQNEQAGKQAQTEGQVLQNQETKVGMPARISNLLENAAQLKRAGEIDKALQVVRVAKGEFLSSLSNSRDSNILTQSWINELTSKGLNDASLFKLRDVQVDESVARTENFEAQAAQTRAQTTEPEKYAKATAPTAEAERIRILRESVSITHPELSPKQREQKVQDMLFRARGHDVETERRKYIASLAPRNDKELQEYEALAAKIFPSDGMSADTSGAPGAAKATSGLPPLTKQRAAEIALKNKKPLKEVIEYYKSQGYPVEE